MNSISYGINYISVAVNDRVSEFIQFTTDQKVQSVALRVLATVCVVSAVVLVITSLSGRVSTKEGLAISAALLVIAYGLILGAQHLEANHEVDLDMDSPSDVASVNTDDFEDAADFDNSIIFGGNNLTETMNRLEDPAVSYFR